MGGFAVKKRYIVSPSYKEEDKTRFCCCAAINDIDDYDIDINSDDNDDDRWLIHGRSIFHLLVDSNQWRQIAEENVAYLSQGNKLEKP